MLEIKIGLDPATGRLTMAASDGMDRATVLDMLEATRQAVHARGHAERAKTARQPRLAMPDGLPIPDLRAN